MRMTAPNTLVDPLHAFIAGAFMAGSKHPIPLVATRFDVDISHGLAIVSARRTFRNAEATSIEATITFPVPVHAVLFDLQARIGGRTLTARAQRKVAARETYEQAIERGKTAVLHEEVLRGVHMLSIGHIPPGEEIEVSATWAMTLSNVNGSARLRIPLTVGDIYGRSGLPDSDDLRHGGPVQTGELTISCRDGQVRLLGGQLVEGRSSIPLNAPIDLDVGGWTPADLRGRAADGREVALRIVPTAPSPGALDVAVVIDHSGSMGEVCSAEQPRLTKHRAIVAGLEKIASSLGNADVIDLWEFDDAFNHVGVAQGGRSLTALAWQLAGPAGGTEIGRALAGVTAHAKARDVLLVTDGKSYALDVQELTRTGRRFAVVLVGEDSLEANVGHLAALSGGDIFVAANAELADVLEAALQSLRSDHLVTAPMTGKPQHITVRRAGMTCTADWRQPVTGEATVESRAVAALAAGLALPALDEEAAAALAESEGLVTHLTSLVLVDETGAAQEGLPGARKVELPTPRTSLGFAQACMPDAARASGMPTMYRRAPGSDRMARSAMAPPSAAPESAAPRRSAPQPRVMTSDLFGIRIDWDKAPQQLRDGDLSSLDEPAARAIRAAAADGEVQRLAKHLKLKPVVLIIGLMARADASRNRSAARIAQAILGDISPDQQFDRLARDLQIA